MALDEQQREAIRHEETLRHEIRKQLEGNKPSPDGWDRLAAFSESKVGFWLVTTVLAGSLLAGYEGLQRYLDRDQISKREAILKTHRDVELVLKLHPMLTSDRQPVVSAGVQLLQEMARAEAMDSKLVKIMVDSLLVSTVAAAKAPDATAQNRMQAETVLASVDAGRLAEIANPAAAAEVPPAAPVLLETKALPVRLYIQVADEDGRESATLMRPVLHKAGILVPGIETVRSTPRQPEIRYCQDKVEATQPGRVKSLVDGFFPTAQLKLVVLQPSQCTKVRQNHFELWVPKAA